MSPTWTISPPLDTIATWPQHNYLHPVLRGPEQYVVTGVFGSIMASSVILRLYTRIFVRRYFGLDDALISVAFISAIGVITTSTLGSAIFEWDRHLWDFDLRLSKHSLINLYLSRGFWGVSSSCVRLSILCLYYRLLERCEAPRHYRWILHAVTFFTIGFMIELILTSVMPCLPIHAYWDYSTMQSNGKSFKCINDFKSMQAAAIINTASEFVMACLPSVAVISLKVDPKQRWNVISLLSLGFLVTVAGIVRSYYLWMIANSHDLTWWAGPHWICAEVEIDLALTCACAAPLRPVFGRMIKRVRRTSESIVNLPRQIKSFSSNDQSNESSFTTSKNRDTRKLSKFSGVSVIDEEDRNAWIHQMSRTIDLEGIAEDGFGYTVTIMGPPKKKTRVQKMFEGRSNAGTKKNPGIELQTPNRAGKTKSRKLSESQQRSQTSPVCWEGTMRSSFARDPERQIAGQMRDWSMLGSPQAYDSH